MSNLLALWQHSGALTTPRHLRDTIEDYHNTGRCSSGKSILLSGFSILVLADYDEMGKRSQVALQKRRSFKRRQARQKKKETKRALTKRKVLNREQSDTQPVSSRTSQPRGQLTPRRAPSLDDETAINGAACSPEQHTSVEGFQGLNDISWEADSPYPFVAGDYATCSPHQCPSAASTDMSSWEADSPSNVDVEDIITDGPLSESIADQAHIKKAVDGEVPMVVVDEERAIEVHLLSDQHRGSEVLRLSTKEYFRRVIKKEEQRKLAIKCLRNKVEALEKQMVARESLLQKEKEEAISTVRTFWRDTVLECGSRGGRMVKAALQKNE